MATEETLFETYSEFVILSELCDRYDEDQVVKFMECSGEIWNKLPIPVREAYKAYLRIAMKREDESGCFERAAVLNDILYGLEDA